MVLSRLKTEPSIHLHELKSHQFLPSKVHVVVAIRNLAPKRDVQSSNRGRLLAHGHLLRFNLLLLFLLFLLTPDTRKKDAHNKNDTFRSASPSLSNVCTSRMTQVFRDVGRDFSELDIRDSTPTQLRRLVENARGKKQAPARGLPFCTRTWSPRSNWR